MLTVGSMFAGIEGFGIAFQRCGCQHIWAAEQDSKCNSVRRRHFPDERTITDVADIRGDEFRTDIITAGWPCQGNSVAGRRAGMADERSGLWGEVVRVLAEQRPRWFLGENVPGLLSVNGGRDLGTVLRDLAELGYGFAYRVLDAQWFGVPQRRRRVFVVGCLGDWRRAAEVLFEPESLPWDTPPSREAGAGVAKSFGIRTAHGGSNGLGINEEVINTLDSTQQEAVAACLNSGGNNGGFRTEPGEHLVAYGGNNTKGPIAAAVNAKGGTGRCDFESETFIAFDCKQSGEGGEVSPPLRALSHDKSHANAGGQVAVAFKWSASSTSRTAGVEHDKTPPIEAEKQPAVAFQTRFARNDRGQPEEVCPTLQGADAGATSDMRPCVAYDLRNSQRTGDVTQTLQSHHKSNSLNAEPAILQTQGALGVSMAVRRLTPT